MIADSTLVGSAGSVDFTSLPSTFAHLYIVVHARNDVAAVSNNLLLRFNGDAGANYDYNDLTGGGLNGLGQTFAALGAIPAATAAANGFGSLTFCIPAYAQASTFKSCAVYGSRINSAGVYPQDVRQVVYWKIAPVAINRITFLNGSGNFIAGSRFTIYGLPA